MISWYLVRQTIKNLSCRVKIFSWKCFKILGTFIKVGCHQGEVLLYIIFITFHHTHLVCIRRSKSLDTNIGNLYRNTTIISYNCYSGTSRASNKWFHTNKTWSLTLCTDKEPLSGFRVGQDLSPCRD